MKRGWNVRTDRSCGIPTEINSESPAYSVFEVCFDMAHKYLKKYLQEEGISGLQGVSPKAIFRSGFENRLINDAEAWFQYTDKRNDTSHEYDEAKAKETLEIVSHFIRDVIDLYEAITGEEWNA